jgi:hypothetical protein
MGPGYLTDEQKGRLLNLLKSGAGEIWSAAQVGADDQAVRAERRRDPAFNARFQSAREISRDVCLLRLYEQVIGDRFNPEAAIAYVRLREFVADARLARQIRRSELRMRVAEHRLRMKLLGHSLPTCDGSTDGTGPLDRDELKTYDAILQAVLAGRPVTPEQEATVGRLNVKMWQYEAREGARLAGSMKTVESEDVTRPGGAGPRGPRTA